MRFQLQFGAGILTANFHLKEKLKGSRLHNCDWCL